MQRLRATTASLLLALAMIAAIAGGSTADGAEPGGFAATIAYAVDGDTLRVELD